MAADTAALIDNAGIGSCHVVGYSLGGFIAEELSLSRRGAWNARQSGHFAFTQCLLRSPGR